jgi:hypothetical protein
MTLRSRIERTVAVQSAAFRWDFRLYNTGGFAYDHDACVGGTIGGYIHICIPAAMMMEMARTHNSMAVKRGYLIFFIIFFLFLFLFMPHDRSFIRYFCLYRYRHCMVCRIDVLPYIRAFMRKLGLPKQDKRGTGAMSCGDEALAKLAEKEPMVRPIASRIAEYRSCETIAANALKTGLFRRHRQDERFADEPQ